MANGPYSWAVYGADRANSLREKLTVKETVFRALLLRELTGRFSRFHLGMVWHFLQPLAGIAIIGLIFYYIRGDRAGIPALIFAFTGVINLFVFQDMAINMMTSLDENRPLFRFRQVRIVDVLFARMVFLMLLGFLVFLLSLLITYWLAPGFDQWPGARTYFTFFCVLMIGAGLGMLFCVVQIVVADFRFVAQWMLRPMFILSGIFFTAKQIPEPYRSWLLINPILQAVELTRAEMYPAAGPYYGDIVYVAVFAFAIFSAGLLLVNYTRKRIMMNIYKV